MQITKLFWLTLSVSLIGLADQAQNKHQLIWASGDGSYNRTENHFAWTNYFEVGPGLQRELTVGTVSDVVHLTKTKRTRTFEHVQNHDIFNHGVLITSSSMVERYKITWTVAPGPDVVLNVYPGRQERLTSRSCPFAVGVVEYSELITKVNGVTESIEYPDRSEEASETVFTLHGLRGTEQEVSNHMEQRLTHLDDGDTTNDGIEAFSSTSTQLFQSDLLATVIKGQPMDCDRGNWTHTAATVLGFETSLGSWTTAVSPMGASVGLPPRKVPAKVSHSSGFRRDPETGTASLVVWTTWDNSLSSQLERLGWANTSFNHVTE